MPRFKWVRVVLDEEFKVDKLLEARPGRYGREFLVRWVGYNHYGDTWEPEEHIEPRSKVKNYLSLIHI